MSNIFTAMPEDLTQEVFETLVEAESLRIERIVSKGHASAADAWYDQSEHEWVLLLEGAGRIQYEDGTEVSLEKGDYLLLPAHVKHRVSWTEPGVETLWLAIFFSGPLGKS
ncbi:cupin domain-containing protein [Shewanella sp. AS16]|uniref:cupin domain-containing protein n=1 Tax=Shewanella sp. AS16 TaxID=2907625 RepID=UPI001F1D5475|nr:cupin domain-containing protein [Shewanella sp. AS16]MCE9686544.1 cupin domain-containing protein [Shewanella sp. AS16]